MEIEEFTGLVHIAERFGLIDSLAAEELLSPYIHDKNQSIDPKILSQKNFLTAWQINKLLSGNGTQILFDGYQLLTPVGFGKLGRTYKAKKINTGELVALKVLRKRCLGNNEETNHFLRQADILKNIEHPNLLKFSDIHYGKNDTPPYLALEWIKGGTVYDWLDVKTFLSCPEALIIMEEITNTFVHLHRIGITHGNFTGTKVLLENPLSPKINNFRYGTVSNPVTSEVTNEAPTSFEYGGLAKHTGESPANTQADIFFAGCLFYHLLTGKSPLPSSYEKRKALYDSGEFQFVYNTEFEKTLPAETLPVIKNMMAIDPKARYTDFIQVKIAIGAIQKKMQAENGLIKSALVSTVFLVIQNDKKRQLAKAFFQNRGFRILQANNLEQAFTVYCREPFKHLVVELDDFNSVKATYMKIVVETELRRLFLHMIFLLKKSFVSDIPARHGNSFIDPPVEFSAILKKIITHEKA